MNRSKLDHTMSNPGIHKNFLIDRFGERETKILKRLKGWWYLTNSGQDIVLGANARLSYFLMKPTTSFAQMFNLDREIICVFSPYPNFEPRSLDGYDRALNSYEKFRIESICWILISDDPNVEDKVESLLKTDPETPIVIPFTYAELVDIPDEYVIRNRFRKHFYTRDLFAFLTPLKKDLYFFGRSELIQEIVSRHRSGEHSSLFGLRKSGKTSVIYAIERFLSINEDNFVSLDCESPSIHQLRWNELLRKVVILYIEALGSDVNKPDENMYDEKRAADTFSEDMIKVRESCEKCSTLIIFDEIERITPTTASSDHWRSGTDFIYFWQTLRAFYQRHPDIFTFLLVGTNPFCIEAPVLNEHENPLFKSIPSTYIPPFEIHQVREMTRKLGRYMGMKFEENIYGMLHDDFGGHPFLIRQVCSEIHIACKGDRPVTIDKPLYEKVKRSFGLKTIEYLEMMVQVLRDWYPNEYEVLIYLANNDEESFNVFASDNPEFTSHLIGYGLIQKSQHGYAFNVELAKSYLQNIHKYERENLTDDEKLLEISGRRNKLEKTLRNMARKALNISVGKKKAAEKVLAALPEARRNKLSNNDIDSLLSQDHSPLFLLELNNVIMKNWPLFENVFDTPKDRMLFILSQINETGRADAHAKIYSNDEFTQIRLHLKYLEKKLEDWH